MGPMRPSTRYLRKVPGPLGRANKSSTTKTFCGLVLSAQEVFSFAPDSMSVFSRAKGCAYGRAIPILRILVVLLGLRRLRNSPPGSRSRDLSPQSSHRGLPRSRHLDRPLDRTLATIHF